MPVIINDGPQHVTLTVILVILVIITIIVLVLVALNYIIFPYRNTKAATQPNVSCTVKPNIPAGLAGQPSGNTVILTWNKSSDADSYTIYVGKVPGFGIAGALRSLPTTNTTLTVTNLIPIQYYFMITATNTCGMSSTSPQITVSVSTWPNEIKVCKLEDPLLCMQLPVLPGGGIKVSYSCASNGCNLKYKDQTYLTLSPADVICVNNNFIAIPNIENPLDGETCAVTPDQQWSIDLTTGRINDSAGLCIGAYDVGESPVFNSDCDLLSAGDSRYKWVLQALD